MDAPSSPHRTRLDPSAASAIRGDTARVRISRSTRSCSACSRRAKRIGIELTEAFQIVPEQSTAAIVIHHPRASYFNAAAVR